MGRFGVYGTILCVKTLERCRSVEYKNGSRGKVAYPLAKKPLVKEIEAAEFLAEKKGVGIYIRGGRSSERA